MIDTAGTMASVVEALMARGATEVYVAATHPLLSGPAVQRLTDAPVKEVVVTNTLHVPDARRFDKLTILSVAQLLATAVRNTHSNESVSQLFD
jgi:ribose-phosphate pyrophosphokinase